ncbi:CHASE3 domain-containing protein [Dongia sp.]|uniref:sensor histidine kinase n=1 Tax=Dongia sp. TaxID=1977262 RepID=UPI0035B07519
MTETHLRDTLIAGDAPSSSLWQRLRAVATHRTFSQLAVLVCVAAFLVIVAVAATFLTIDNRAAGAEMLRSQRFTTDLARLLLLVQRAETSQRGYLLTGNKDYVALYRDSIGKFDPALSVLVEETRDDLGRAQGVLNLRSLVAAKRNEMDRVLTLFDSGRQAEALSVVRSNAGKSIMDQIRASIAEQWTASTRTTEERIAAWRANSNWLLIVQIGAAFLVMVVSALAVIAGLRHMRGLQAAQHALAHANELLEDRVAARTAELVEANAEIQKFAYIISHDLRSPLVNIMGFASELAAIRGEIAPMIGLSPTPNQSAANQSAAPQAAAPAQRPPGAIDRDFGEALGFIQQSTAKMDRLIGAVLKLARSGQRQFHFERIEMNALIGDIAASLKHRTDEVGAVIAVTPLPMLTSDRLAVEQIFSNLLDNAVKYLDDSRLGRIDVRARTLPRAVLFEVEDNGRGISEADLTRIFDLFRRGGKQDRPGEGIGLAHLKVLIRRLGGKITCRSTLGQGSVFSVLLPQGEPSATPTDGNKER